MPQLYHASSNQELRLIKPHLGTHTRAWVYATHDIILASTFLSTVGGDYTCSIGRDPLTRKPYLCERFAGAFEYRYGNRRGAIYQLPGDSFSAGQTGWVEEWVSQLSSRPTKRYLISDVEEWLLALEKRQHLIIRFYPERIADIPSDDSDLVEKTLLWAKHMPNAELLSLVNQYHPALMARVMSQLGQEKANK